jgi:hypothetical protein
MPDQYHSEKQAIGQLLKASGPDKIVVPEWQRSYCWTSKEVGEFWSDLCRFYKRYPGQALADQEYFLGSIVMVRRPGEYELLDGQQRLATATMLIVVLCEFLKEYNEGAYHTYRTLHVSARDYARGTVYYPIDLNRTDGDFFRREVQEMREDGYQRPETETESHKLIRAARQLFVDKVEGVYAKLGRGKPAFDWAVGILQAVTNHVSVVAVTSQDEDNAASVFEMLNDRGIGLSTPDLVHGLLMRRAKPEDRDTVAQHWRDMLLLTPAVDLSEFLRHYWITLKGDVRSRGLYREIKGYLQGEKEDEDTGDEKDSLEFSRDLRQAAFCYHDILTADDDDSELSAQLRAVRDLGAKSVLPAILAAWCASLSLDPKQRLLRSLVSLYVRHVTIGGLDTTDLEDKVFEAARTIRAGGDLGTVLQDLKAFAPDNDRFAAAFAAASVSRNAAARYILRQIEDALVATGEYDVAPASRVTLEHIYPRSPAFQKWDRHEALVDRLGNLTLLATGINRAARNSDFATKKPHLQGSALALTKGVLSYDEWSPAAISERQAELAGYCADIWAMPD